LIRRIRHERSRFRLFQAGIAIADYGGVPRLDDRFGDDTLSCGLKVAHRAALMLIALSTMLLLMVLLKERVIDRLVSLSRATEVEAPLICSPIESTCPMVRPSR
jgi:hypothetical protein